jgi:hypothetical protein
MAAIATVAYTILSVVVVGLTISAMVVDPEAVS